MGFYFVIIMILHFHITLVLSNVEDTKLGGSSNFFFVIPLLVVGFFIIKFLNKILIKCLRRSVYITIYRILFG